MASKKGFRVDETAKDFLSPETIAKVDGNKEETKKKAPKRSTPKQEASKKELRTRRVQLLIQPSLYEEISQYAEDNYISTNGAIIKAIASLLDNAKK